jgi:hypothetical protein
MSYKSFSSVSLKTVGWPELVFEFPLVVSFWSFCCRRMVSTRIWKAVLGTLQNHGAAQKLAFHPITLMGAFFLTCSVPWVYVLTIWTRRTCQSPVTGFTNSWPEIASSHWPQQSPLNFHSCPITFQQSSCSTKTTQQNARANWFNWFASIGTYAVKGKVLLCLTKHHAMEVYWGNGGIDPCILWLRH